VFNDSQPDRHSSVAWVVKGRTEGTWGYRAQFNSRLRRQSQPAFHFRPRLDTPTRSQNCGSLRKACTENSVLPSISRGSLPFFDHRSSGISFNGLRLLVGNVVRAQCQVSDRGTAPLATAGCTRWNSLFCWSLTRFPLETVASPLAEASSCLNNVFVANAIAAALAPAGNRSAEDVISAPLGTATERSSESRADVWKTTGPSCRCGRWPRIRNREVRPSPQLARWPKSPKSAADLAVRPCPP